MIEYNFERIGLDKGLSQSVIYDIFQDRTGMMWFATQDGLNRYDGYNFKVYKGSRQGFQNNYVRKIFEDSRGNLWLGTSGNGILKYDRDNDIMQGLYYDGSDNITMTISEDNYGNIWFGSSEDGLKILKAGGELTDCSEIFKDLSTKISRQITCLHNTSDGCMIIGSWDSGIYLFNPASEEAVSYRHSPEDINSLSNDKIFCIHEDHNHSVWIGTRNGLNKFDREKKIFEVYHNVPEDDTSLSESFITCLCRDKENILWIGTKNGGLNKFDECSNKFGRFNNAKGNHQSLSSDIISSVYNDESNVLWVGTFGGCINKLDCSRKKFYFLNKLVAKNEDIILNNVMTIFSDTDLNLWVGTYNQGLYELNDNGSVLSHYKEDPLLANNITGLSITGIADDSKGNLWITATRGGLNKFDKLKKEFKFFPMPDNDGKYRPLTLCKDKSGECLWLGTTDYGLLKFHLRTESFVEGYSSDTNLSTLRNIKINDVHCDDDNNLWIGTRDSGLIYFDVLNDLLMFMHDKGIEDNPDQITTVSEDRDGNILAGKMQGFLIYDKVNNVYQKFFENEKSDVDIVKGILEDDEKNYWISSGGSIVKFNKISGKVQAYDKSDGLNNEEYVTGAFHRDRNGFFYFGGTEGINYFLPSEIRNNDCVPKISITEFSIFNSPVLNSNDNRFLKKNICEADEISLTYRESVFSFEFASLSFNNPPKNLYAYMMEGFDKDWIYCGTRRFATYTNLEPGAYVFRVKGSNNDGVWNDEGTSVRITISPPFWKTWWFKSLGAASIAGLTGLAYRQKLLKIEKEKKSQEEFSRKLLDSQEQERKRISTELHHTIAHDILITKNKAVMGLRNSEDSQSVKNILNEISDLASNTLNDVRSISYNLHPHQIERLGMTKAIRSIVNQVSKSTQIQFVVELDDIDKLLSKELEINVFRIVQECFNNILKHSKATFAELKLKRLPGLISLSISDNGTGFSKSGMQGLGLRGMTERIKLYNGTLEINSEDGRGTAINILLPVK